MLNDDQLLQYNINYWHVAEYATLIVKATVYNKPFTFNLS